MMYAVWHTPHTARFLQTLSLPTTTVTGSSYCLACALDILVQVWLTMEWAALSVSVLMRNHSSCTVTCKHPLLCMCCYVCALESRLACMQHSLLVVCRRLCAGG